MTQQTRHVSDLRKRDFKQLILFCIGSPETRKIPNGPKNANIVHFNEIDDFFKSGHVTDKGLPLARPKTKREELVRRRKLYRYLEELVEKEKLVQRVPDQRGFYKLTELGLKKLTLISQLYGTSEKIPLVDPLSIHFGLGMDEQGRTAYADILIRVSRPDVVQTIEEAMTKNKISTNDISTNEKMLGNILCTVIMWDLKGVLSRLGGMWEGNEDVLSRLIDKLPFTS
jgi:hypothetical protein